MHRTTRRPRSLAILPFRNLNGDPKTDFLGFSLADEIITKLDYVNSLTVRPSSSIDKYRDQVIDPQQVAKDLKVDTLLTGSFIKDGDNLRITAQLVDVKPDKILWRGCFRPEVRRPADGPGPGDAADHQGNGVEAVAGRSGESETGEAGQRDAYEAYLRGIDLYSLNQFAVRN